jgi:hypothetical protein
VRNGFGAAWWAVRAQRAVGAALAPLRCAALLHGASRRCGGVAVLQRFASTVGMFASAMPSDAELVQVRPPQCRRSAAAPTPAFPTPSRTAATAAPHLRRDWPALSARWRALTSASPALVRRCLRQLPEFDALLASVRAERWPFHVER